MDQRVLLTVLIGALIASAMTAILMGLGIFSRGRRRYAGSAQTLGQVSRNASAVATKSKDTLEDWLLGPAARYVHIGPLPTERESVRIRVRCAGRGLLTVTGEDTVDLRSSLRVQWVEISLPSSHPDKELDVQLLLEDRLLLSSAKVPLEPGRTRPYRVHFHPPSSPGSALVWDIRESPPTEPEDGGQPWLWLSPDALGHPWGTIIIPGPIRVHPRAMQAMSLMHLGPLGQRFDPGVPILPCAFFLVLRLQPGSHTREMGIIHALSLDAESNTSQPLLKAFLGWSLMADGHMVLHAMGSTSRPQPLPRPLGMDVCDIHVRGPRLPINRLMVLAGMYEQNRDGLLECITVQPEGQLLRWVHPGLRSVPRVSMFTMGSPEDDGSLLHVSEVRVIPGVLSPEDLLGVHSYLRRSWQLLGDRINHHT